MKRTTSLHSTAAAAGRKLRATSMSARLRLISSVVPWGLVVLLTGYAAAVLIYVWSAFWSAPEYQAAQHYQRARALLGADDGRRSSPEALEGAYVELLEAARLLPQLRSLQEALQRLDWRLEERKLSLPRELKQRAAAVATSWKRIDEQRQPLLVTGVRERGWAPDQVLEGPERALRWAGLGGLLLAGLWAWWKLREGQRAER
jgi:hypothetical protein